MSVRLRRQVRQLFSLVVVASLYLLQFGVGNVMAASPVSAETLVNDETYDICDNECGAAVSCDQPCWSYGPEQPYYPSNCGIWGGAPAYGAGNCLGTCGDAFCNEANEEDAETCYEDCGVCGDTICSGPEDLNNCAIDCHECGDNVCSGPYETCSGCGVDCNPTSAECGSGSEPGETCGEDQVENGAGYCCDVERQIDGFGECALCDGPNQQCMMAYYLGYPMGWVCVGVGETCGETER